jgi:hypothetical protein
MTAVIITSTLDSGELLALANPSFTQTYLSHIDPVYLTTASCQVDAPGGLTLPTAAFKYKNTSANFTTFVGSLFPTLPAVLITGPTSYPINYTDITLWIGTTAGAQDKGIYRLRGFVTSGGSSYMQIGEYGSGDPGMIPEYARTADIADGDYVTLRYEVDLWSDLPRIDSTNPYIFAKDYDNFSQFSPFNMHMPLVVNMGAHRSMFASNDGNAYNVTFFVSAYDIGDQFRNTGSGSDPIKYAWTIPPSWTVTGGDASTNTVTCTIPVGFHIVTCVAYYKVPSDSGDLWANNYMASWGKRLVWVHDRSTYPPRALTSITEDNRDRTGRTISININDAGIADIPHGSIVNVWETPTWGGSDVPTATKSFIGWMTTRGGSAEKGLRQGEAEILGPAGVLGKLGAHSQAIQQLTGTTGPVVNLALNWQEMASYYLTPQGILWYLLLWHVPNMARYFDYNSYLGGANWGVQYFDSTPSGNDPHTLLAFTVNAGSVWSQFAEIAARLLYNLGCDSSGALWLWPDPSLCDTDKRSNIVNRDTLTESQIAHIDYPTRNFSNPYRRLRLEAFTSYGLTADTALITQVPGAAFAQGTADEVIQRLTAYNQDELDRLAGHVFAQKNAAYQDLTITKPGNYDVIEPAHMQFFTVDISAQYVHTNVSIGERCVPVSVSKQRASDGTVEMKITLRQETSGVAGVKLSVPATGTTITPPPPPKKPPTDPPTTPCDPGQFPAAWIIQDGTLESAHTGAASAQELSQNLHTGEGGGGANSWNSAARINIPSGATLHDWGYDAWFHDPGVSSPVVYDQGSSITLYDASNSVITAGSVSARSGYDSWLHVGRGSFSDLTGVDHIVVVGITHGYGGGDGATNPLDIYLSGLFACWS